MPGSKAVRRGILTFPAMEEYPEEKKREKKKHQKIRWRPENCRHENCAFIWLRWCDLTEAELAGRENVKYEQT